MQIGGITFEWDPQKAQQNELKHRVRFVEAATVFADPLARYFEDREHSVSELRLLVFGHSAQGRLLVVSFTERRDRIRIISARRMDAGERQEYEETIQ